MVCVRRHNPIHTQTRKSIYQMSICVYVVVVMACVRVCVCVPKVYVCVCQHRDHVYALLAFHSCMLFILVSVSW